MKNYGVWAGVALTVATITGLSLITYAYQREDRPPVTPSINASYGLPTLSPGHAADADMIAVGVVTGSAPPPIEYFNSDEADCAAVVATGGLSGSWGS
jgi:hypothetical protein